MLQSTNQKTYQDILIRLQNGQISPIFKQAIDEDAYNEDVWLSYANQVTSLLEKRYCLERAKLLNPKNRQIHQQLQQLLTETTINVPSRRTIWERLAALFRLQQ